VEDTSHITKPYTVCAGYAAPRLGALGYPSRRLDTDAQAKFVDRDVPRTRFPASKAKRRLRPMMSISSNCRTHSPALHQLLLHIYSGNTIYPNRTSFPIFEHQFPAGPDTAHHFLRVLPYVVMIIGGFRDGVRKPTLCGLPDGRHAVFDVAK
jgi:hypothetical protein